MLLLAGSRVGHDLATEVQPQIHFVGELYSQLMTCVYRFADKKAKTKNRAYVTAQHADVSFS